VVSVALAGCSSNEGISEKQKSEIGLEYVKSMSSGTHLKMGATVAIPTWFDSLYLSKEEMQKGYRVSTIQVFGIVGTGATHQSNDDYEAYEFDVDLEICAGKAGFPTQYEGLMNAGSVADHLWLRATGLTAVNLQISPTLIDGARWINRAPALGPNECFRGVGGFEVPVVNFNMGNRRLDPTKLIHGNGGVGLTSAQTPVQPGFTLTWFWQD